MFHAWNQKKRKKRGKEEEEKRKGERKEREGRRRQEKMHSILGRKLKTILVFKGYLILYLSPSCWLHFYFGGVLSGFSVPEIGIELSKQPLI